MEPLLIGSYGRDTGIYPGKDVDVFLRFTGLDTRAEPRAVFNAVWRVIVRKYGQYGQDGGRAQQQARSVKVLFPDRAPQHFYYSYELTYPPFLLPLPAPQACFPSGSTFTDSGQAVRYRCRGRSSSERT